MAPMMTKNTQGDNPLVAQPDARCETPWRPIVDIWSLAKLEMLIGAFSYRNSCGRNALVGSVCWGLGSLPESQSPRGVNFHLVEIRIPLFCHSQGLLELRFLFQYSTI